jgi:hypothetical protein
VENAAVLKPDVAGPRPLADLKLVAARPANTG